MISVLVWMDVSQMVDSVLRASTEESGKRRQVFIDHIEFLKALEPQSLVRGVDSFNGYIGALFPDGISVFDNAQYGNAVYVLKGDWEDLTKKSRGDLRRLPPGSVIHVPHHGDWKSTICLAMKKLRRG